MKKEIPHFKHEDISAFYQKYNVLQKNINVLPIKKTTQELGQIIHYICDYFCTAHNEEKYINDLKLHTLYEVKLQKRAKQIEKDFFKFNIKKFHNYSFRENVEIFHQGFCKQEQCYEKDLIFAFKVSFLATSQIIGNMTKQQYSKTLAI